MFCFILFLFFKQKTAYEMRISDWSSDVCSSDLFAGGPFGAVVVKDGEIVGEGWNRVTSQNDPTAHAEVVAIREACGRLKRFDLRGAVLYTSCEPCPMCLAATYWARVDRLY